MLKKVALAVAAAMAAQAAWAAPIDFHGYMRAGFGYTSEGGGLVNSGGPRCEGTFCAPYTQSKFRLGNESTNYGEMVFGVRLYKGADGSQFNYVTNIATSYDGDADYEGAEPSFNDDGVRTGGASFRLASRENFVSASGIFEAAPLKTASVWIGKRFYQRHDIHMTDYFYLGNTGMGAGIENISLGDKLRFSYAWLQNNGNDNNTATRHDFRLAGIPLVKNTNLEVGLLTLQGSPVNDAGNDGDEEMSYTAFAEVVTSEFMGGFNKFFVSYNTNNAAWNGVDSYSSGYGDSDASLIKLIDHGVVKLSSDVEMSYVVDVNMWDKTQKDTTSIKAGVRPVFSLSEYQSIAVELGLDYVVASDGKQDDGTDHEGAMMTKLTGAYQLQAGKGYWARPALRFYATYATWNDEAKAWGTPANGRFGDDDWGLTYGAQVEAWW